MMRLAPRRAPALVVLALAVFWLLAAPAAADDLVITDKDNGGSFRVHVGQKIKVNLRDPGSGGYNFLTPEHDKGVLKMVGEHRLPRSEPRRLGDFGRMVYEFQAQKVGQTNLVIPVKRPWEKKSEIYLQVTISVQP
jgi:predicted secreted protein